MGAPFGMKEARPVWRPAEGPPLCAVPVGEFPSSFGAQKKLTSGRDRKRHLKRAAVPLGCSPASHTGEAGERRMLSV